jgi:hypothetical protein
VINWDADQGLYTLTKALFRHNSALSKQINKLMVLFSTLFPKRKHCCRFDDSSDNEASLGGSKRVPLYVGSIALVGASLVIASHKEVV